MASDRFVRVLVLYCLAALLLRAQEDVRIRVDAARTLGPYRPVWNYFGYDEANYTYAPNGRKLLGELAAMSDEPVHVRVHNLLTTGDGKPALKWGSTNVYTEDATGKEVYQWTIVDQIFDTFRATGIKPFVEIGFMPEALSVRPEPYQHSFSRGTVFTGWSYPPTDYRKWSELVYQFVMHLASRYDEAEVASWEWEVWNEPNIGYWHGTAEEYDALYDATAAAVKRALPAARVGGPATTGPADPKAAAFLRQFLAHCVSHESPLDFISFHAKGRPETISGHLRMGLAQELKDVRAGFEIVRAAPELRDRPIVLSEADPEGCAACSARTNPQNAYRNGALYASYEAAALELIRELAAGSGVSLEGVLTWAFEFEGQPYFEGFRTLATNGIDKPVLNFFRAAGLLRGHVVALESSGRGSAQTILREGVKHPIVDGVAVRSSEDRLAVLLWNYQDEDVSTHDASMELEIAGLPQRTRRALVKHFRIDETHSNSYTAWKRMGSPAQPSAEQFRDLERAAQLQLFASPGWIDAAAGTAKLQFTLPSPGVSLIELSW